MAVFTNNLRLKEIVTGDEEGVWGGSNNLNLSLITDAFGLGTKELAADADETFTIPNATKDDTRSLYLRITSAVALTVTRTVTLAPNTVSKIWIIENATTGGQSIEISQGSGANVTVPTGQKVMVITDGAGAGAAVFNANPSVLLSSVSGTLPVANGGTGATTASAARTALGATTVGGNLFTLANPGAIRFLQLNADNTVTALSDSAFRTAIGAGSGAGTVTSVSGTGTVNGITLSGTVTTSGQLTLGGTLSGVSLTTQVAGILPEANGGTGASSLTYGIITGKPFDVASGEALCNQDFLTGVFSDEVVALGNTGTALSLNASQGGYYTATLTGNCTITISAANAVANRATSFALRLTNDGTASRSVALAGGTFRTPGGSLGRTTAANAVDVWFFVTRDGGTNWDVHIPQKNLQTI